MCGIVGLINFKGITQQDIGYFTKVLIDSEVRGSQATGVGLQDLSISKAPIKASEFVKTNQYYEITKKAIGQKWIIGHTRHATQGPPTVNSNNHPLRVYADSAIMVHNGVVHSEEIKSDKSKTDSYIIADALKKSWGNKSLQQIVKDAYKLFYGYAATIVVSKRKIVFSTVHNPISSGVLSNKSLIFASQSSFFPHDTSQVNDFSSGDSVAFNSSGVMTRDTVQMAKAPAPVYNWDSVPARANYFTEDDDFDDSSWRQSRIISQSYFAHKKKKDVKVSSYERHGWGDY